MITTEYATEYAQKLYKTSIALAEAIEAIKIMEKDGYAAVEYEQTAAETVQIQGDEVIYALRSIALRLDRAVLTKF